ncbi:MAG: hypothetical protein ABR958_01930 [Dehalococcoidales bacterium]
MAMKHDDLKKLSDDDLKKKYDEVAGKTVVGLNFFFGRDYTKETAQI